VTDRRAGGPRHYGHHWSCRDKKCEGCCLVVPIGDDMKCTCDPSGRCPIEPDCDAGSCTVSEVLESGHSIRWPSGAIATTAGPRTLDLEEEHDVVRKLLLERGIDPCAGCASRGAEPKTEYWTECGHADASARECSYQSEINGVDRTCLCCDSCAHECAMDV